MSNGHKPGTNLYCFIASIQEKFKHRKNSSCFTIRIHLHACISVRKKAAFQQLESGQIMTRAFKYPSKKIRETKSLA